MKENCTEKQNLAQFENWMVVKFDHSVVKFFAPEDKGSVNDMDKQKDENPDASYAVQNPSPHTRVSTITPKHSLSPRCGDSLRRAWKLVKLIAKTKKEVNFHAQICANRRFYH